MGYVGHQVDLHPFFFQQTTRPQFNKNCEEIMRKHNETYEKAIAKHPERWSKNTINWTFTRNMYH